MKFLLLVLLIALNISCGQNENNHASVATVKDTAMLMRDTTIFDRADSVELYHSPDPGTQKIFSKTVIADTMIIKSIVKSLKQPAITSDECPHHWKMYFFKNGDVFKTVYFSDSCNYLAYSVNAQQVFKPLDKPLADTLKSFLRKR